MGILILAGSRGGSIEEPPEEEETALATVVNGLDVGEWGTLTVGNTYDTDPGNVTGSNNSSWLYSPLMLWEPVNDRLLHYGGIHDQDNGQPPNFYHVVGVYDEASNEWQAGEQVPVTGTFAHGYDMAACDNSGNLYFFTYDNLVLRKRNAAGTYSNLGTLPSGYNITRGLAFNPNMGTGGGVVMGDALNLYWYDIAGAAWNEIEESGSLIMGEYSQSAVYVEAHDACYIGGGEGDSSIIKVNANATFSEIAAPPRTPYTGSFGGGGGLDSLNLLMATTTSHLILASVGRNEYYEFNGTSWSSNLGTFFPSGLLTAAGSEKIMARGMVPAHGAQLYDAFVFGYLTSQSAHDPATTFYVRRYD